MPDHTLVDSEHARDATVRESLALQLAQAILCHGLEARLGNRSLAAHQVFYLRKEPRVDTRIRRNLLTAKAGSKAVGDMQKTISAGHAQLLP